MAKRVKQYKGFVIKETTARDREYTNYAYLIFNSEGQFEWQCDSIQECMEWIDCY